MEWEGRQESSNVEDRRGQGLKYGIAGGGAVGIIVVIVGLILGVDTSQLTGLLNSEQPAAGPRDPEEDKLAHFTKVIFKDTETVWGNLFEKMGEKYRQPTLVMFTARVNSACGPADAGVGPFYCPGDEKVYIDLSFYREMQRKLDAPGDFARAYVIAHEVGHHVQKLLGYDQKAEMIRQRNKSEASVRLELQADYLAGVWAYHGQKTFKFLQPGDLESALNAAWQIGDDTLTRKAGGIVKEEAFTHGSSAERQRWFRKGFDTGSVSGAAALFDLPYQELK